MKVQLGDVLLLAHATFGVLGTLCAVWVFVETVNAREDNSTRTRRVALVVAGCMCVACFLGGYWYLHFYPADKAMILKGPWPFAHNIFMETKEHLFFLTLVLSLYLPIAAWDKLWANSNARKMVLCVSMLIALTGMAIEGSGAIINHGAKLAYIRASVKGAP
jgi:hypothetical protein